MRLDERFVFVAPRIPAHRKTKRICVNHPSKSLPYCANILLTGKAIENWQKKMMSSLHSSMQPSFRFGCEWDGHYMYR